jgi:hypothetical protein
MPPYFEDEDYQMEFAYDERQLEWNQLTISLTTRRQNNYAVHHGTPVEWKLWRPGAFLRPPSPHLTNQRTTQFFFCVVYSTTILNLTTPIY